MNSSYIPFAVIAAALLIYVFERMRQSIPSQVVQDYKELALKLEKSIPVDLIPFVATLTAKATPLIQNAEKTAISTTKALLRAYADETSSPIDDSFCQWLDALENKEKAP